MFHIGRETEDLRKTVKTLSSPQQFLQLPQIFSIQTSRRRCTPKPGECFSTPLNLKLHIPEYCMNAETATKIRSRRSKWTRLHAICLRHHIAAPPAPKDQTWSSKLLRETELLYFFLLYLSAFARSIFTNIPILCIAI